MRTSILAWALLGLALTPSAFASPANPAFFLVQDLEERTTLLAWSPVSDAESYIVYRGSSVETLVPYASVLDTYFVDDSASAEFDVYGVASWDGTARSDIITTSSSGGNCFVLGPGGKFSLHVMNCVNY